ncbi:MAG TPA: hypothetical protein VGG19_11990 [Tepidisphaeraceae bacterium]
MEYLTDMSKVQRRRKDQIRDAGRHRSSPHRTGIRSTFNECLHDAADRSEISFHRAQVFMSALIEDIVDRLMSGKYVIIPRLAILGIVPMTGVKRFRLHVKPDTSLYTLIAQSLNIPSKDNGEEFWRIAQRLERSSYEQIKRGVRYQDLMTMDRVLAIRQANLTSEYINPRRAEQRRPGD